MTQPGITDQDRELVRAYATSNMDSHVTITRPGALVMSPDLSISAPADAALYSGIGRCHLVVASGAVSTGEGQISQRQGSVSIPFDAPIVLVNDLVLIDSCPDPQFVGTTWRILGINGGGSFAAYRELSVTSWQASNEWTGQ